MHFSSKYNWKIRQKIYGGKLLVKHCQCSLKEGEQYYKKISTTGYPVITGKANTMITDLCIV
jgi:hypothetical protein